MLKYAKKECCSIIIGMLFMIGATSGDVVPPLFYGAVIDLFEERDFDGVNRLCAYFLIMVVVSINLCSKRRLNTRPNVVYSTFRSAVSASFAEQLF